MSASDEAARLRAQAEALDAIAVLEDNLTVAKANHANNPNPASRSAKQDAAQALRDARALARTGRTELVGGDAYIMGTD